MAAYFLPFTLVVLCCLVSPSVSPRPVEPIYKRDMKPNETTPIPSLDAVDAQVSSYRCGDGPFELECINGGSCILDDKHFPVCSCPDNWRGPHCEHRVSKEHSNSNSSPSNESINPLTSHSHLYLILLAVACGIIVMLIVIIAVIAVHVRRRGEKGGKGRKSMDKEALRHTRPRQDTDLEMQNSGRCSGDSATFGGPPSGSNRLYFGRPAAVSSWPTGRAPATAPRNVYIDDMPTGSGLGAVSPYRSSVYDTLQEEATFVVKNART